MAIFHRVLSRLNPRLINLPTAHAIAPFPSVISPPSFSFPSSPAARPRFNSSAFMHSHLLSPHSAAHPIPPSSPTPSSSSSSSSSPSSSTASPSSEVPEPTALQLRRHALHSAIPFVGFGFIDNLIMITAGDMIDNTLGVHFALPTLVAAACGQVLSDTGGVLFGSTIEAVASRLGLPASQLTEQQYLLRKVQVAGTAASAAGVILGCLLGMSVMLCMDLRKAERQKRQAQLARLLHGLMGSLQGVLRAEECTLWLYDEEAGALLGRGTSLERGAAEALFALLDADGEGRVGLAELVLGLKERVGMHALSVAALREAGEALGVEVGEQVDRETFAALLQRAVGAAEARVVLQQGSLRERAVKGGEAVVINEAQEDARYSAEADKGVVRETRSLMLHPILDPEGCEGGGQRVLGLVELRNRIQNETQEPIPFSEEDARVVLLLSRHIGYFNAHLD